jgi:hypothetical protein
VQIKDNSKDKRIKPFAHFLLGVARQSVKYKESGPIFFNALNLGTDKVTNNGFSWALGGGLDIRVHRRIDIRVIQLDYNPVRTKEQTILAIGDIRDFSGLNPRAVGFILMDRGAAASASRVARSTTSASASALSSTEGKSEPPA